MHMDWQTAAIDAAETDALHAAATAIVQATERCMAAERRAREEFARLFTACGVPWATTAPVSTWGNVPNDHPGCYTAIVDGVMFGLWVPAGPIRMQLVIEDDTAWHAGKCPLPFRTYPFEDRAGLGRALQEWREWRRASGFDR